MSKQKERYYEPQKFFEPSALAAFSFSSLKVTTFSQSESERKVGARRRLPIVDMHLHAVSLKDFGGGAPKCADPRTIEYPGVDPRTPITFDRVMICAKRLPAAATDDALMKSHWRG